MKEITDYEKTIIASLSGNVAFQLLLTSLEADLDDLLDAIEMAKTNEEEQRLVSAWRALRHTLATLKIRTEESDVPQPEGLAQFQGFSNFGRMVTGEEY